MIQQIIICTKIVSVSLQHLLCSTTTNILISVSPTVHLIRHAQGYHNLSAANHSILDPILTPYGVTQCEHLSKTFPHHSSISTLVASPLRRTLYTALNTFPSETSNDIKVIALPELQEISNIPCDTGSETAILQEEFKDNPVELGLLTRGWNSNTGKYAPTNIAIATRAHEARLWLREQKGNVAVVTHGGFLHYLTQDWEGYNKAQGTGWTNCEYRTYCFKSADDENASLIETEESIERRSKTQKLSREMDKAQFMDAAIREWESEVFPGPGKKGKDDRGWIGAY